MLKSIKEQTTTSSICFFDVRRKTIEFGREFSSHKSARSENKFRIRIIAQRGFAHRASVAVFPCLFSQRTRKSHLTKRERAKMKLTSITTTVLVAFQRHRLVSAFAQPLAFAKSATFLPSDTRTITQLYSSERDMTCTGFVNEDPATKKKKRDQSSLLSAVAIEAPTDAFGFEGESLWSTIQPVLSTALLITGNTVGASCLILPEMAAQPGMSFSFDLPLTIHDIRTVSNLPLFRARCRLGSIDNTLLGILPYEPPFWSHHCRGRHQTTRLIRQGRSIFL